MTLNYERFLLLLGLLAAAGLLVSFEAAAVLGVFAVVALGIWARRRSAGECPSCGARLKASRTTCERCGFELRSRDVS
jgi:tRNA(Ile2) C34 agmatinyltransferase TiaS